MVVAGYGTAGAHLGTTRFGSADINYTVGAAGNVWIGGYSGNGTFADHTYVGGLDAFVAL